MDQWGGKRGPVVFLEIQGVVQGGIGDPKKMLLHLASCRRSRVLDRVIVAPVHAQVPVVPGLVMSTVCELEAMAQLK